MIIFGWWADLFTQGWLGAIVALWIVALVVPLVLWAALELAIFVSGSARSFATSLRTRTLGPS